MHEVKPVTSGHRLVLTYNLIHTTLGPKELAANSDIAMAKLRLVLSNWKEKMGSDPLLQAPLAFLLEHQYTEIGLSCDALKGHDQQLLSHLRPACEESEFDLYLANFSATIHGDVEAEDYEIDFDERSHDGSAIFHDIKKETYREISLGKVVDLNGNKVAEELNFEEESFIQKELFKDVKPNHESYSGWTGKSAYTSHFYHRTVRAFSSENVYHR
jgi:hypothetical protein